MQTFLPYPDFDKSAAVLDRQRLGKQRVENLQIMKALVTGEGWINHPATKMWRGHETALLVYQGAIVREWVEARGYKDTCLEKTEDLLKRLDRGTKLWSYPAWLGLEELHASHRSNLLRKAPDHYKQFGWTEPDDLEYIWPI